MATNRTFTMLKPDAIENGHMGKILAMIIDAGFTIKAMKFTGLRQDHLGGAGPVTLVSPPPTTY
ncbi:MAG: nucleoside-diphosphate kinase, partial [Flavobacteriales bacterium]